jgi:hypothetical protein
MTRRTGRGKPPEWVTFTQTPTLPLPQHERVTAAKAFCNFVKEETGFPPLSQATVVRLHCTLSTKKISPGSMGSLAERFPLKLQRVRNTRARISERGLTRSRRNHCWTAAGASRKESLRVVLCTLLPRRYYGNVRVCLPARTLQSLIPAQNTPFRVLPVVWSRG